MKKITNLVRMFILGIMLITPQVVESQTIQLLSGTEKLQTTVDDIFVDGDAHSNPGATVVAADLEAESGAVQVTNAETASENKSATTRIQIIHNSADAAASEVDVWLNDTKLLENFAFRTATPFIDAPAGVLLNIGIAPPNSTSWTQSFKIKQVVLTENQTYIAVAIGITSSSGYSPSPIFDLKVYPVGREAASQPANTDVLVVHGATDAPTVDVYETGIGAGLIVDDLTYGNVAGYLELHTSDYILEVRDESGTNALAAYDASLASLGLEGSAITVLASGFLNPANNSNGADFGLYVATAAGGGLIPLPVSEEEPATVVDIIVGSDVHTTLAAAVVAADLVGALSGEGPFTVFAPTNDAFDALPAGLLDDLLAEPEGLLTDILLYHVVGAAAFSTDLSDGQAITTLFGQDVVVTINDDGVFINDAQVIIADLEAENGVVHVIGAVLVPSDDTTNVIDVIDVADISIDIYPNPASSVVNISSNEDINHIRVIDVTGRIIQDMPVSGMNQTLNINNLQNGLYFLQISTNAGILTERIQVVQ